MTQKKWTHLTEDINVMRKQLLQREKAKTLQQMKEDQRMRMERDQRMEEEWAQYLEERRRQREEERRLPMEEEDTVELSLERERERRREQQQLAAQEFLREQERRLPAGEELLRELEREKEQDRLAGVEEWREWEEEWWDLQWEQEMEQEGMELESFTPAPAAREQLLKEDVVNGLPSIESGAVDEDTEELHAMIGGMQAIESGVVNEDTEVLSSLEREALQELGSFNPAPGARVDLDWIFVITNFILELSSAVFDQLSSGHKPQFALLGMLMSYAALFICFVELVYKCRKEKVTWKWRGTLPWLYDPSQKPFGRFEDIIGLVCAISQCVVATIAYSFCLRHADHPIKISIWPIIFAFCLLCSKLLRDHRESHEVGRPPNHQ